MPPVIYSYWDHMHTYISQLELLAMIAVMVEFAAELRGSSGLWFVDNVAALMALVRGRSDSPSLDAMAQFAHVASFALHTRQYYEYVESAANWSDEVSRRGLRGKWAASHGFQMRTCTFACQLLSLPPNALVRVLEYL